MVRVVVAVVAERPVLAPLVVAEQLRQQAPLAVAARLLLQRQPAERKVLPQEAEVAAALLLVQGLVASVSLRSR